MNVSKTGKTRTKAEILETVEKTKANICYREDQIKWFILRNGEQDRSVKVLTCEQLLEIAGTNIGACDALKSQMD